MTDLNVFQLIQIYLATDNERPIDEKAKFAAFEWTLQQTMALGSTSEIYKSETILSTIIARLFDARKTVLEVIQTATTTDQDTDQQEEDKIDIKADIDDSSQQKDNPVLIGHVEMQSNIKTEVDAETEISYEAVDVKTEIVDTVPRHEHHQPLIKVNNFKYWLNAFGEKAGRKFIPGEVRQVFGRLKTSLKEEALTKPIDELPDDLISDVWAAFQGWTNCPVHLRHIKESEIASPQEIKALAKKTRKDNYKYWVNLFEEKAGRKFKPGECRQVFLQLEKVHVGEVLATPIDKFSTVLVSDVWAAYDKWTKCPAHLRNVKPKNLKRQRIDGEWSDAELADFMKNCSADVAEIVSICNEQKQLAGVKTRNGPKDKVWKKVSDLINEKTGRSYEWFNLRQIISQLDLGQATLQPPLKRNKSAPKCPLELPAEQLPSNVASEVVNLCNDRKSQKWWKKRDVVFERFGLFYKSEEAWKQLMESLVSLPESSTKIETSEATTSTPAENQPTSFRNMTEEQLDEYAESEPFNKFDTESEEESEGEPESEIESDAENVDPEEVEAEDESGSEPESVTEEVRKYMTLKWRKK